MTSIEKPKTLAEILQFLDATDQGIISPTPEQQAEVGALLTSKIDNTAEFIDELEFQAERLRVGSARLADGKRAVLARIERLKGYMAHHMLNTGFSQIPGDLWRLRLTSGLSVELKCDPDPLSHPARFIRIKYEWDKKALAKALAEGDLDAQKIAKAVPSNSVAFAVNTGKTK